MKILVSSCAEYAKITLPILLPSLLATGVVPEDIIVCLNADSEQQNTSSDGIIHHHFSCKQYEYVVFNGIKNGFHRDDDVFWLHDTCEVALNFKQLVEAFVHNYRKINPDFQTLRIASRHKSGNMGFYRSGWLQKLLASGRLDIPRNISKRAAVSLEDRFWAGAWGFQKAPRRDLQAIPRYTDGVTRIVEYFDNIGLMKYKANWRAPKLDSEWRNAP